MKIFKRSIINFLKGLKYIFTPIGILSLSIIIGFSIAIPNIISSVMSMVNQVSVIVQGYQVDWDTVSGNFYAYIMSLDYSQPEVLIQNFTDTNYLFETLKTILGQIFPTMEADAAVIGEIIQQTITAILFNIMLIFVWLVIGIVAGYIVVRLEIKGELAHHSVWKFILSLLIDSVLTILVIYLAVEAFSAFKSLGFLFLVLLIIAHLALTLLESYLFYGKGRIPFKKAFSFKNIIFLLIANTLLVAAGIGFILLINLLDWIVVTVIMAISIFEVDHSVIMANAQSYVVYLAGDDLANTVVKQRKKEAKAAKKAEKAQKKAGAK